MLATAHSPSLATRIPQNNGLLSKNDLISFHHLQQQLDGSTNNMVRWNFHAILVLCCDCWCASSINQQMKSPLLPGMCSHMYMSFVRTIRFHFSFRVVIRWMSRWTKKIRDIYLNMNSVSAQWVHLNDELAATRPSSIDWLKRKTHLFKNIDLSHRENWILIRQSDEGIIIRCEFFVRQQKISFVNRGFSFSFDWSSTEDQRAMD